MSKKEEKITIRVNIADRFYPIKIDKQEEETVRLAAKRINDTVMQYKKMYVDKDDQDFLAMAGLHFVTKAIENERNNDVSPLIEEIKNISQELGEYISNE